MADMDVARLPSPRPPCSAAERSAATALAKALSGIGLRARLETFPAPTSAGWVHMVGALFRLTAAALILASVEMGAVALAGAAFLISAVPQAASMLTARLPAVGGRSQNTVAHVRGDPDIDDPPLVVAAHLDTHASAGEPLSPIHRAFAGAVSWGLALTAGLSAAEIGSGAAVVLLALEPAFTIAWLARQELTGSPDPEDNASGLAALTRTAERLAAEGPVRDVWLVGTGAATSGNWGITAFLRAHPDVARVAWLLELDSLGTAEIVACPARQRVPRVTTPQALVRAVAGAAIDTGDPIDIRRVRRPHSDADIAFARRVPALALTAGLGPVPGLPQDEYGSSEGFDVANVERATRIVDRLARTTL